VVTDQDELLVDAADIRASPGAIQRHSPFQNRPRNVQASRDDTAGRARVGRADVNQDTTRRDGSKRVVSVEPGDPGCGLADQTLDRVTRGTDHANTLPARLEEAAPGARDQL